MSPAASLDTTPFGDLVDFKTHLAGLEDRMREDPVGAFMDTSKATTGHLYTVRDELRRQSTTLPCSSSV